MNISRTYPPAHRTSATFTRHIFDKVGKRISRTRRIQENLRIALVGAAVALTAFVYAIAFFRA